MEARPEQAEKVIVIALQRHHLWQDFVNTLLRHIVLGLTLITLAVVGFGPGSDPGGSFDLFRIMILVICFLIFFVLVWEAWFLWLTFRRLISQEPVLVFDEHGITVCDLLGKRFFAWVDITALASCSYQRPSRSRSIVYLGIQLKNVDRYFLNFHLLLRLLVRRSMQITGNPISVPQRYLSMPITEILSEIQQVFRFTLYAYRVQISI